MVKEIRNFELEYDGVYHIKWTEGDKTHYWYIHLALSTLLKMIEIEGISLNDIKSGIYNFSSLKFQKAVLCYSVDDDCGLYYAWGFIDRYLGTSLNINNCYVEISPLDSMKNHEHQIILGDVSLLDEISEGIE